MRTRWVYVMEGDKILHNMPMSLFAKTFAIKEATSDIEEFCERAGWKPVFYRDFRKVTVQELIEHLGKFKPTDHVAGWMVDRYRTPEGGVGNDGVLVGIGSTDRPVPMLTFDDHVWVHAILASQTKEGP